MDRTERRVAVAALALMAVAVVLTVLDDGHLGVLDGPVPRALHALALYLGLFGVGWTFGSRRLRKGA